MNEKLKIICDTVSNNVQDASTFYTMEYKSSFAAYGIANADRVHTSDKIEEAKKLFKERFGKTYSFNSGAAKMTVLSKVVRSESADGTLDKIQQNYELMKKAFREGVFTATLAALLADWQGDINVMEAKAEELLKIMRKRHPLLGVSSSDYPVIALMAMSDKSADEQIRESDAIYEALKKDFKFDKENAYTVSYLLAGLEETTEWKIKSAAALKETLKEHKIKFSGYGSIAILSALTAASMRVDRSVLVNDIVEADKFFASQKVIGGVFGLVDSIRHMLAASCVLKAVGEDEAAFSKCEYLTVMSCYAQIKSEQDSNSVVATTMM